MKQLKRSVLFLLAATIIASFCACSSTSSEKKSSSYSSSGYSSNYDPSIKTSSAAISAVKNYATTEHKIAGELGFNKFYSPDYGSETAKQKDDGSWSVTLKGKMSGYTDEYHDDFESYKFEVSAEVTKYGGVRIIRVKKVY